MGAGQSIRQALEAIGVSYSSPRELAASLPFAVDDTTAGSETELQAVVVGERGAVDLPQVIEQSNYFANVMKRAAAGEAPRRLVGDLERFLADNPGRVWENSWVRLPRRLLSSFASHLFDDDLRADKRNPAAGRRRDSGRFSLTTAAGEEVLRLPISYLIKLALADHLGSAGILPPVIRRTGIRLLEHYLNDNTSPETFSFNVVSLSPATGLGRGLARETAVRFLLTQLLVMYANRQFDLARSGQRAMIYFAPHPPVRQQELNDLIPDAFYRELFMSPCLSGWDRGEEKHRYMELCHQVLSRSQLNAVAKLREAGIIVNNLVVLPRVSSVSLANNGTHVSLGSRRLTAALGAPASGFTAGHEKYLGDLVTKIVEHFLPLFVGTYSAAPYRLAYTDFHPERALGFLPHELDYTHLRMIWRRWRRKAQLSFFGNSITPFGPAWLDRLVSGVFGLTGDCVPDYRLIDYLVCLLSTERSPALDGAPGNTDRLRKDLAAMGVFDEQLSVYLLYKQREFAKMGFSGFEGRYYSQFESFAGDLGRGVDLQTLVTALAFKYLAAGMVSHESIPDDPAVESERRQFFFGAALGIPTLYVQRNSGNVFLRRLLERTGGIRSSRRYPGYLRVPLAEYRRALLRVIAEDGADLGEMLNLGETLRELAARLEEPDRLSAAGRLTRGILAELNASSPLAVEARAFNEGAERYYRETLRRRHLGEALHFLGEEAKRLDREPAGVSEPCRKALRFVLQGEPATAFLARVTEGVRREELPLAELRRLINLVLLTVYRDAGPDEPAP